MNPKTFDAIIFDFGGVIIDIDYNLTIEAFKSLGRANFDELFSQAHQSDLFSDFETGVITPDEFISGILDYLPSGTTRREVIDAWNAMILEVPTSSIELLLRLKGEGKKIYLLSNTNSIHIEYAYKLWDTVSNLSPEEVFNRVYLSHEMHMRKPNPEIFQKVCDNEGLNPQDTIFIDDSIQHIEGARSIGLNALHLTNEMDLQSVFS